MHSMMHRISELEEPLLPIQKFVMEDKVIRLQYSRKDGWSVWHDGQFVLVYENFFKALKAFIRVWRAE